MTAESKNSGILSTNAFITPISKSIKQETICGVYCTRASKSFKSPSIIAGADITIASTTDNIIVVMASHIALALPAITSHNLIIPTPICSITYGINPIRLATNVTIAPPLAAKATANAVIPAANINTPAPAANMPTPNKAIAPDNPNKTGTKGPNNRPATPITANAPAKASKAFPISAKSIDPSPIRTGVKTARAEVTTNNAKAPGMAPFIRNIAPAIITNEPASATKPRANSSQLIEPIILRAPAKITKPTAIIGKAKAPGMAFFIATIATEITKREPARTVRPLAISSQDIVAIIFRAPDKTTIANAIVIIPAALRPVSFGNKLTAPTKAPKPATIPISAIPISSKDIDPIIFKAIARIRRADDNFLIAFEALFTSFSGNNRIAATKDPRPTIIPRRAVPISSKDIVLNIFNATDSTKSKTDRPIMAFDILFKDPIFFPSESLPNIAIAPNNSMNNVVIAASEVVSFSESIRDNTNSEPAKIAIETAIFFKMSAFIDPVNALRASPTPPRISFIFSKNPPALSVIPVRDFMNFLIPKRIAANNPPFTRSNIELKSALPIASPILSLILWNASPILLAIATNIGATFFITLPRPINIFFNNSPRAVRGLNLTSAFSVISANASPTVLAKVLIPSATGLKKLPTVSTAFTIFSIALLNRSEDFIALSIPTIKSPIFPVNSRIPFPAGEIHPTNFEKPLNRAFIIWTPISNNANTPLNVLFRLFAVVSPILNFSVNFLRPSVKLYNCSDVIGGKISCSASFIGLITLITPSKALRTESINAVLPPKSFQP